MVKVARPRTFEDVTSLIGAVAVTLLAGDLPQYQSTIQTGIQSV